MHTWSLTRRAEKKLNGNYTRILGTILNKSWWQQPTKQQLYGHLPPITIQVRRSRYAGHCWSKTDELISEILLWTLSHGQANAERLARTYMQQLCADTGCSLENQSGVLEDREGWQERVKEIRADATTLWCSWGTLTNYFVRSCAINSLTKTISWNHTWM